ncbi:GATA zinc finger domain-containing protein 4-like [Octopus bimaculoides]|uniref:GATA zinc finger domain-containing protein 4-like n=1 Tax=Octopus bimaculoides TaxID=37653 RepID=UPI00071D775B|nr:GATA zinc finger domain-containing protein 4-like [Octopus bimaculoides]|eukprot:XP_014779971.1 PREDICTED: GATA zinc finger domain-containing protein 4-like [Octopus bimaculoides]
MCSNYSSINLIILNKALWFADNKEGLTRGEIDVVLAARKSIIQFDSKLWIRQDEPDCFTIPMRSSDTAQVSDLVRFHILSELVDRFPYIRGGLYHDDCLLYLQNTSNQKLKRNLVKFFSNLGQSISFDDERNKVNFLDLTLNLHTALYFPRHKPSANLKYISIFSNRHITRNLVKNISVRKSKLSANETVFNSHTDFYNSALYKKQIKYYNQVGHNYTNNHNNSNNDINSNRHNNNKSTYIVPPILDNPNNSQFHRNIHSPYLCNPQNKQSKGSNYASITFLRYLKNNTKFFNNKSREEKRNPNKNIDISSFFYSCQ